MFGRSDSGAREKFLILKQKIVVFGQFSPKFSTGFPAFYTKLVEKIPVESRSKIAVRSPDRDFQKSLSGHRDPGPTGIPVGYWLQIYCLANDDTCYHTVVRLFECPHRGHRHVLYFAGEYYCLCGLCSAFLWCDVRPPLPPISN